MNENEPTVWRPPGTLTGPGAADDDHTVQLSLTEAVGSVVGGQLMLVVANDNELSTRQLPAAGRFVIGRAESADLTIADPSMSRHHFVLQIDNRIVIEDLGSSNGTRVGDRILGANEQAGLDVGVPVQGGQTTFVLRRVTSNRRPRRIVNHGYFELRAEEESLRVGEVSQGYAVVRISDQNAAESDASIETLLGRLTLPTDIIGAYGPPGEYEVLLVNVAVTEADERARDLESGLAAAGCRVLMGMAAYPRDGVSPDSLVARAGETLRGDGPPDTGQSSPVYGSAMARIQELVDRVALGQISVLVLGETGVGKEVLSKQIHLRSRRSRGPMMTVNCASLNEELLASELFGHVRGAFTGAVKDKIGLIEAANGGTLFLDEVGDVAPPLQAKLLRVLEEGSLTRVGEVAPREVDVRFISATNRDLEQAVRDGEFREDLYYRLAGVTIVIPPLRERIDEIVPLARAFVRAVCERDAMTPMPGISPRTVERLLAYDWPGNIRELRNMVERAVLLSGSQGIEPEHLLLDKMGPAIRPTGTQATAGSGMGLSSFVNPPAGAPPGPTGRPVDRMRRAGPDSERESVLAALDQCDGNQTKAARMLGISRGTLIKRMERYGLDRPRKRDSR